VTVSPSRARRLARRLLRENRKLGRSWRTIAREDFGDQINFATLNRFALSEGKWIPNEKIQTVLGLKKPRKERKPLTPIQEAIKRMAKDTRELIPNFLKGQS
jgi:hypothetical protein